MRNVIGRENLILHVGERMNSPRFIDKIYSFSRESFYMADRTGLDRTTLHYLAVQWAMVSVHRPVHSKIMVTYALTWHKLTADGRCTLRRMAFEALQNAKVAFSKLCSNLLCAYCSNKLPEQGPTKAQLRVLSIMPLRAWAHWRSAYTQLSELVHSLLLSE